MFLKWIALRLMIAQRRSRDFFERKLEHSIGQNLDKSSKAQSQKYRSVNTA